jgi:Aminoacyl-tRNA editing domain
MLGAETVELASENEFRDHFADCETGSMPPFGNLYGMDVFVDQTLAENLAKDKEIAFNAGSHRELVRMRFVDFRDLVKPAIIPLAAGRAGARGLSAAEADFFSAFPFAKRRRLVAIGSSAHCRPVNRRGTDLQVFLFFIQSS